MEDTAIDMPAPANFFGGAWVEPRGGRTMPVHSPSDGSEIGHIADSDASDVDAAVAAARAAFEDGEWGRMPAVERGRMLSRLSALVAREAEPLAHLESLDNGKPLSQARADMAAAARYFEYYGGAADKVHGETLPFLPGHDARVVREPHGVTGHIIPWNYPAQMFGRTLAPALAMGNAVVLKPAEDACLSALRLAALAEEAGFPAGALNIVTGRGDVAGAALAAHPGIDFLSFTGSPEVGTAVQAAAARNHVACTLELGGKSPQVVFADADLDAALPVLVNAIVQNAGQTCSAGSRVLIERPAWEELMDRLARRFGSLVAAPALADRDLGPLISARQKARVERYLDGAGAEAVARGSVEPEAPSRGHYVAPALLGPVDPTAAIAQEEVFGPVLVAIPFDDEAEAIRIANGTRYGLVAGIWTRDGGRQQRVAKALRCGQVFINGYGAGGGIELPFGGRRRSGHGREKGFAALHEFSVVKTIVHNHG